MLAKDKLGGIKERILIHRALGASIGALAVFVLGFILVPVLIAEASAANSASLAVTWDTVTMLLDPDADDTSTEVGEEGHGDIVFGGSSGITPVENNIADSGPSYGRLVVTKKRIGVATSGTFFSVYLSMDNNSSNSLIMDNTNLQLEAVSGTWDQPKTFVQNGGSGWGFAVPNTPIATSQSTWADPETAEFPDFSPSVASSAQLDQQISYNTDGATNLYNNSVWTAVPLFNAPQQVWKESNDTHDGYGFGTYTVNVQGVPTEIHSPHSDSGDARYKSFDIYYAVAVDTNVVAGTYSNNIVYTGIAAASSLDTVSTNLVRDIEFGGENDVQTLRFDLNDSAASVTTNLLTVALVPHSVFAANNYTIEGLDITDYDTCDITNFTRNTLEGYSELTCTMPMETPETGYGDGTYDYWINIDGYDYNYVSKISYTNPSTDETSNVGAFIYAGLQTEYATSDARYAADKKVVTEMQDMTPGICDLTNMWKNTTSVDAQILDYNGLTPLLAAGVDTDGISSFLLTDNRDNKTYKVRRLAEGKCHMVQNLDLNLADAASETIVLNNRNTNLTTIETWVPDADISETFAENNAPRARDKGLDYVGSPTGTDTTYTSEHATRYVGDYYNWLAVGAGTGSTSTTDGIGDNNICPYNWSLPWWNSTYSRYISSNGKPLTQESNQNAFDAAQTLPLSANLSGSIDRSDGSINYYNQRGGYWTAVSHSGKAQAHVLSMISVGFNAAATNYKTVGRTVRCVNKGSNSETVVSTCDANHVCYNNNGGTGTVEDQAVEAAETPADTTAVLASGSTLSRDGYYFAGWVDNPTGYSDLHAAGETVTVGDLTSNGKTYYAKWVKGSLFEGPASVASFDDGMENQPMEVKIAINPVQEGTGDPSPDNIRPISGWTGAKITRTGKNLLEPFVTSRTQNGVAITANSDGSIKINGTATAATNINVNHYDFKAGTYNFTDGLGRTNLDRTLVMYIAEYATTGSANDLVRTTGLSPESRNTEFTYNPEIHGQRLVVGLYVGKNRTVDNVTIYPMLRLASETDSTYEPYKGSSYSVSFPQEAGTVYGGELTIYENGTGKLVVDHTMMTFDGSDMTGIMMLDTSTAGIKRLVIQNSRIPNADGSVPSAGVADIVANRYRTRPADHVYTKNIGIGLTGPGIPAISVYDPNYQTLEEWAASLQASPLQVVYKLATPQTYDLSASQVNAVLTSLNDTNNIWADTGDILQVKYHAQAGN